MGHDGSRERERSMCLAKGSGSHSITRVKCNACYASLCPSGLCGPACLVPCNGHDDKSSSHLFTCLSLPSYRPNQLQYMARIKQKQRGERLHGVWCSSTLGVGVMGPGFVVQAKHVKRLFHCFSNGELYLSPFFFSILVSFWDVCLSAHGHILILACLSQL
jgi:hypothetical protein